MKQVLALLMLTTLAATPLAVWAGESAGRRLAELAFSSVDSAERGFIDMGEFSNFGKDIFVSMDSHESGKLSLMEFMGWGYGMSNVAEDNDRIKAYETALRILFAIRDRDGDGEVSKTENRKANGLDFQRADLNGDAIVTKEEFLRGFIVMIAFRAALDPNL